MSPESWYLARASTEYGPYTLEQLSAYVSEGRIVRTDLLRQEGASNWRSASEIPGLFGPEPGPPPMPIEQPLSTDVPEPMPRPASDKGQVSPVTPGAGDDDATPGAEERLAGASSASGSRRRWILPMSITVLVLAAAAGIFWFTRPDPDPCSGYRFAVTEDTASLAFGASDEQREIIAVNGPPEAFTVYWDPHSGAEIEEWSYYTLGQELLFVDGAYQGGIEVPPPEVIDASAIPTTPIYPWEARGAPRASCIVRLAGPALFRTSALVLPGWNDEYQVARLWTLAGGGSMITVDGRLAMVSIDPGEPLELASLELRELLIGTLGQGSYQLGALLTPGELPGTYRLSFSPRGQGTTADGTEYVIDLTGSKLEGTYTLGQNARLSVVALDGTESPGQASGTLTIKRRGDAYQVQMDVWLDNYVRQIGVEGLLAQGLWRAGEDTIAQVLDEAWEPVGYRSKPLQLPAMTPLSEAEIALANPMGPQPAMVQESPDVEDATLLPEMPAAWQLSHHDSFDVNRNTWPLNQGDYEFVSLKALLADGRYFMDIAKTTGTRPWIAQTINLALDQRFAISVLVEQTGASDAECGLYLRVAGTQESLQLQVSSTEGRFRLVYVDGGRLQHLAEWTETSAIRAGTDNRLSLLATEDELLAFINGQQVTQVQRSFDAIDQVGLVGALGSDGPLTCSFDDLVVREP